MVYFKIHMVLIPIIITSPSSTLVQGTMVSLLQAHNFHRVTHSNVKSVYFQLIPWLSVTHSTKSRHLDIA